MAEHTLGRAKETQQALAGLIGIRVWLKRASGRCDGGRSEICKKCRFLRGAAMLAPPAR
jgi:hypothetical protein